MAVKKLTQKRDMKKAPLLETVFSSLLFFFLMGVSAPAGEVGTHPSSHPENHHGYTHHGGQHSFKDAEAWAKIFEAAERDVWQKPEILIKALRSKPDMLIADIGSATGYFPVRFAKAVPKGKVYAIDIEKSMVDYLNARARRENLSNLTSILAQPDDPNLPQPVDLIFICNTYHHIADRTIYFEKLKKNLRPGAQLVIVDFIKGDLPVGPPDSMKLSPEEVRAELAHAGYSLVQKNPVLPYQYVLVFQEAGEETPVPNAPSPSSF